MNYIEYLKRHDSYDKYVLFLLALDFSISDVARYAQVSRETVYQVMSRNEAIVEEHIVAVNKLLNHREKESLNDENNETPEPNPDTSPPLVNP